MYVAVEVNAYSVLCKTPRNPCVARVCGYSEGHAEVRRTKGHKTMKFDMRVTLGTYSDHPVPENCVMVGELDESGVLYRLALNTDTKRYVTVGEKGQVADFLDDQQGVLDAVIAAYGRIALPDDTMESRYVSCKLDKWAADAIRKYGGGNLARGARKLADILVKST